MTMPKGYLTNINIKNQKIGEQQRQALLDKITNNGTLLPRGVLTEDMDNSFVDFVGAEDGLSISTSGNKVPVIFLTLQKWTEFTKTWAFTDKYKDIQMPFITVVRRPDIQQGQNQAGLWNIAGGRTYTMVKVQTWDGIRKGIDLYKIPQPTSVDITYEVRLFTHRMKDLNVLHEVVQKTFQSRQHYITPNGHPMPLKLITIGDESNVETLEDRKFYVQTYEMTLLGYLLDEKDFIVVPSVNRTIVTNEISVTEQNNKIELGSEISGTGVTLTFTFLQNSSLQYTFSPQNNITLNSLVNVENISRIIIKVNNISMFDGLIMSSPLIINTSDLVTVKIYKPTNSISEFQLIGTI